MANYLSDTKIRILQALYSFPYLTADRITKLLFSPGSLQRVRGYVTELAPDTKKFRKQYLLRDRRSLNDSYIYWLADAGRDVLRGHDPNYNFTKWKEPRKMQTYISSQDFPHHITTTDFLIEITNIAELYPEIKVSDLIHYFHIHADPATTPIKPDGVIKLLLPNKKPFTICLEIDLATEGEEKIKAKIAAYIPYIIDGSFAHDYLVGEVPLIVFYTPTEKRRDLLLTWIEKGLLESYSANKASWFRVGCGTLSPELFFEKIWITPGPLGERKVTALLSDS